MALSLLICQKCGGTGIVNERYDLISRTVVSDVCPVCEGAKIITELDRPECSVLGNWL